MSKAEQEARRLEDMYGSIRFFEDAVPHAALDTGFDRRIWTVLKAKASNAALWRRRLLLLCPA